jgi:hypothetical protein
MRCGSQGWIGSTNERFPIRLYVPNVIPSIRSIRLSGSLALASGAVECEDRAVKPQIMAAMTIMPKPKQRPARPRVICFFNPG